VQQFDLAIIGGGLIGASMARAMSGAGLRVVVLDQQPADALYAAAQDNRGLALSYTSSKILAGLNCWQQLAAAAAPIKSVHVSEHGVFGFTTLTAAKFNIPELGYVVSASALGQALVAGLECLPDISVIRPVNVNSVNYDTAQQIWDLDLDSQISIQAKLLVAADGSDSFLRHRLNIAITSKNYQQSAIVTNISTTAVIGTQAYERFTDYGVLALLPFGAKMLKCVWTVENSALSDINCIDDAEFLHKVQAAFGFRLGRFLQISKRMVFAIQQLHAQSLYAQGVVLIGNAANTLHPVAAQGFNLGLRDVSILAQILLQAQQAGHELNSQLVLQKYANLRARDHQLTQKHTNGLVAVFASDASLVKYSRRLGILATQFIPWLNERVTAQGLGLCK